METYEKPLPSNPDAERAILGAVLLDNSLIDEAAAAVTESEFYLYAHKTIWGQMLRCAEMKIPIEMITLCEGLKAAGKFAEVGGMTYLATLIDGVSRLDTVEPYARIVREKAALRQMISGFTALTSEAFDAEDDAEVLEHAQRIVFDASSRIDRRKGPSEAGSVAYRTLERAERIQSGELTPGISSGFTDLDYLLCGMQPGDQIVLAARPSMGKTAMGLSIALNVALRGIPVGMFELEMSELEIGNRMLSIVSHVPLRKIRLAELDREEWGRLGDAARKLHAAPLLLDDSSGVTVAEIRSKARRMVSQQGVKLLVIDYLGLIRSRTRESRNNEVGEVSRELKDLAKELHVPVILLAQLNRMSEQRAGKEPQLSDLRDSGEIEQNADSVIFIHRDEYYDPTPENRGRAKLLIRKQRNGAVGNVEVAFLDEFTAFENMWRN